MTTPNVYGRTTPMTAKERDSFMTAVRQIEERSPQQAVALRAAWEKIVAVIGEEP